MKEEALFYECYEPDYLDTPYRPLHHKSRPQQEEEQQWLNDNLLL